MAGWSARVVTRVRGEPIARHRKYSSVRLQSAGQHDGNKCALWLHGIDLSTSRRGINIVALDPRTVVALQVGVFDTSSSSAESTRLASWVGRLGPGTVVAACGGVRPRGAIPARTRKGALPVPAPL